ncbi:hypothetical protein BLOT_005445 [Blomia tropicalis]|nr:hypothetical protein BLOT_005445 [Blomia tropicalis]
MTCDNGDGTLVQTEMSRRKQSQPQHCGTSSCNHNNNSNNNNATITDIKPTIVNTTISIGSIPSSKLVDGNESKEPELKLHEYDHY